MRKLIVVIAGAALLLVGGARAKQGGPGPRLDGSFRMTATIMGNDIGIEPGAVTTDVYVFKSTCGGKGGCAKVGLRRESGDRDVKSTLHRTAPGVYKGTEGPEPYTCIKPLGDPGQFTGDHKITVTKSKNGRARKVTGRLVIHITGCSETYEEVK